MEALAEDANNSDRADRFAIANSLHVNFYADAPGARAARRHVDQIETPVDTPEPIPSATGGSPPYLPLADELGVRSRCRPIGSHR